MKTNTKGTVIVPNREVLDTPNISKIEMNAISGTIGDISQDMWYFRVNFLKRFTRLWLKTKDSIYSLWQLNKCYPFHWKVHLLNPINNDGRRDIIDMYIEQQRRRNNRVRSVVFLLSTILVSFGVSFLVTVIFITNAHASVEIVATSTTISLWSYLVSFLFQIFLLLVPVVIFLLGVQFLFNSIGINLIGLALPKQKVIDSKGNEKLVKADSIFDLFGFVLKGIYKLTRLLGYIATVTILFPFVSFVKNFIQKRKPQGFMRWTRRIFLLNPFHKGLLLNGKFERISKKQSYENALVVAPVGAYKSSSYIIPNVLTRDDSSMIILDISKEIFKNTSGYLSQKKGYKILSINLSNPTQSHSFNPLHNIVTQKDINDTAHILVSAGTQNEKDEGFWTDSARRIIRVVLECMFNHKTHLVENGVENPDRYFNLPNLAYIIQSFGRKGNKVRGYISKYGNREGNINKSLVEFDSIATDNSDKVLQSILTTATTSLRVVSSSNIQQIMTGNDIDFAEIRSKKTALYININLNDLNTYSFLVKLLFSRFYSYCFQNEYDNVLPTYLFIDEAGNMGSGIPNLAECMSFARKYKVSASLVFQSLKQLETAYGKTQADTIIEGSATNQLYFSGLSIETCQRLSSILGMVKKTEKDEKGNKREVEEPLMSPNHIRMLSTKTILYLYKNKKPILLRLKPYFKNFFLKRRAKVKPYTLNFQDRNTAIEYVSLNVKDEFSFANIDSKTSNDESNNDNFSM